MSSVSICIAAYQAEAFLAETIESALVQSWPDVEIVVSIDPGTDRTAEIANSFAARGVRVVCQPKRLGWVGNTNAAIGLATSRYAMILPHDDVLDPQYVTACMSALEANSAAVLAYPDMAFGGLVPMHEPAITGDAPTRIESFLRTHFDAIALRGVFDRERATQHLIPRLALGDYAADTLWVGQMAAQGELVRVPQFLYWKRVGEATVHAGWKRATPAEMAEMWGAHCAELRRVLQKTAGAGHWSPAVKAAWHHRVVNGVGGRSGYDPARSPAYLPLAVQLWALRLRIAMRKPPYSWMTN